MASFAPSSSSSSDNPIPIWTPSSSVSAFPDEPYEDSCSICLEPFCSDDPATITSCKHDYHLHCILEWSQRSKECPICWQLLVLKDPASQGLLDVVQNEKRSRARNISSIAPPTFHNSSEDFDFEHDSFSDDSDLDERIMQHLAAASSRARYVRRRERQRYSGLGPSNGFNFSPRENVSGMEQAHPTSPVERPSFTYGSPGGDSPTSPRPPVVQPPPSFICSTAANNDPFKPRVLFGQPTPNGPQRQSPSEMLNFPESIKSKLSAASARYKESISKGTRGLKEKLLARNNSVKEMSKGVQREMTAGIAGVARMFERLDLTSKKPGAPTPVSGRSGGTSNFSVKGKAVLENVIVQSCNKSSGRIADESSEAPSQIIRLT
ncbi:putative transcription factor C2H2 family [Rosa chinensis]|uniref:RING-type E3 ubiquitin transferase n=1 Tax=Rosa chinensis TaxID=74649 RepID=A0A2P6QX61_ROSCH|nr:E3 ubiquitin-protein ligase RHF1A isoform X1 [Rosa chinensis]XP_024197464.1 E3 ubiquitin-protein ligase RHF1A isoform X1 [Rosa chinensis]PRQ38744.1 putative transcription factor C2H2 family [Rosa chinensis]